MQKHVVIAIAAVTVAVAAPWLLLQPDAERAARPPGAEPSAAAPAVLANVAHAARASADEPSPAEAAAAQQPSQQPAANAPAKATIRVAFESEPRDASAPEFESKIRAFYAQEPEAEGVLRDVSCTRSVCKIDARWSAQLNRGYNAALLKVIGALSKDVSLEPAGAPDGNATPITIYVRRPPAPVAAP